MFYGRIAKYDPKYRNDIGHYTKDEWSFFGQIGQTFEGKNFTVQDYLNIEEKYIDAIINLMDCLDISELQVNELSKKGKIPKKDDIYTEKMIDLYNDVKEDMFLTKELVVLLVKLILRENLWCKLESKNMYVHFGWDFYMYIGGNKPCQKTINEIEENGLFVEKYQSPYSDDE